MRYREHDLRPHDEPSRFRDPYRELRELRAFRELRERPRAVGSSSRHWNRDEDMGGSDWSGASGRGGMGYDQRAPRGAFGTNEAYGGGYAEREPYRGPYHEHEEQGPFYRTGPKGYRRPDARIYEDVCEIIAQQGYIDARDVEVTVEDGLVRLNGTVVRRHDRRMLEHMIDRVSGIEEIHNDLRLRRVSPQSSVPSNGDRRRV